MADAENTHHPKDYLTFLVLKEIFSFKTKARSGKQSEYQRPRVIFMCSEATKDALQKWARREKRTLSNMIERIENLKRHPWTKGGRWKILQRI